MPGRKEVSIKEGGNAAPDTPKLTPSISKRHRFMSFSLNESMEGHMQSSNTFGSEGSDCNYYSCTPLGDCLYFFGGVSKSGKLTNKTLVFHVEKLKWYAPEQLGTVPSRRRAVATVAIDNQRIIVHGGYDGTAFFKDCFIQIAANLDSITTPAVRWEKIPQSGDIPHGRSSHSMALLDNSLYLFGGTSKVELFDGLHAMSFNDFTWNTIKTHGTGPRGRVNPSLVASKDSLYCFGGLGKQSVLHDMYKFEIATSTWTQLKVNDALVPKNSSPKGCYDSNTNKIYFFCGGPGMLSYINIFDLADEAWSEPVTISENLTQKSVSKLDVSRNSSKEAIITLCDYDSSTMMEQIGFVRLYPRGSGALNLSLLDLNFTEFYNDKRTADIIVKTQKDQIYAHKILLFTKSTRLSQMVQPPTNDSNLAEIVIENGKYPFEILQAAIKYCYDPAAPASINYAELPTLSQFASEYGFDSLKVDCDELASLRIDRSNVCKLLKSAYNAGNVVLKFACLDVIMREKQNGKIDFSPLMESPEILVEVANYKQYN